MPLDAFTVAAWVRLVPPSIALPAGSKYALVTLGTTGAAGVAVTVLVTYPGGMGATVMNINGSQSCSSSDRVLSDGAWHHVAFTYSASNSKFTCVNPMPPAPRPCDAIRILFHSQSSHPGAEFTCVSAWVSECEHCEHMCGMDTGFTETGLRSEGAHFRTSGAGDLGACC